MNALLGKKVIDRITGFEGTVTGHVEYLTGCNQALVVPTVDEKGLLREGQWFDVQRLQEKIAPAISLDNSATPGPDAAPPRSY